MLRPIQDLQDYKNIYLPVTLEYAQEFFLVTFHSLQRTYKLIDTIIQLAMDKSECNNLILAV